MSMTENDPAEQESKIPPTSFPTLGEFKFKNDTSRKYRVYFQVGGSLAFPASPVEATPHEGDVLLPQGLGRMVMPDANTPWVKAYVQDVTSGNVSPDAQWYMAEWHPAEGHPANGTDWIYAEGPPGDDWPITVLPASGEPGTLVHGFTATTMPPGAHPSAPE